MEMTELSPKQLAMVKRAKAIQDEQRELNIEISTIARQLGYQGVNVWDEIQELGSDDQ